MRERSRDAILPLRIGVTGLMASGKSSVARRFEEHGAVRVDGDALGWETLRVPDVRDRIAAEFGVVGSDGAVDRARLGALVFADPAAMERLNAIVQPPLRALVVRRLDEASARAAGPRVVVLDAAMLTTWRLEPELDAVVEVTAPERLRIERLRAARGFTEEEAARRVFGQSLPPVRGARRHWRIQNEADPAALQARADEIWRAIEALAAAAPNS